MSDWKDDLNRLRSAMGQPSTVTVEAKGATSKMSAKEAHELMSVAQTFLDRINAAKPKLEAMHKIPGRVGDSFRVATRMTQGFSGPVKKFIKELRRAIEAMK